MGQGYGKLWVKGSSLNTLLTLPEPDWLLWNMLYHWAEHCKPCKLPESLADLVQHKKNAQTQVRFGTCIKVVRPFQTGCSRKWSAVLQWMVLPSVPGPPLLDKHVLWPAGISVTHTKHSGIQHRNTAAQGATEFPVLILLHFKKLSKT